MSRKIRKQMQKKRFDKNACLLVLILIFFGILTFLLLTASDNNKLNNTLNEKPNPPAVLGRMEYAEAVRITK